MTKPEKAICFIARLSVKSKLLNWQSLFDLKFRRAMSSSSLTDAPTLPPSGGENDSIQRNYLKEFLDNGYGGLARIVPIEQVPPNPIVVKSLLWTYQKQQCAVLCVLSLATTVDKTKLGAHLNLVGSSSLKQLKMASPQQVIELSGQEVGNVSPIGHKRPLRTIVDKALLVQHGIDLTTPAHNSGHDIHTAEMNARLAQDSKTEIVAQEERKSRTGPEMQQCDKYQEYGTVCTNITRCAITAEGSGKGIGYSNFDSERKQIDAMCYGGGGTTGMELEISLREIIRISNAEIVHISAGNLPEP
jgi:prolyl-tRNA editing enzyme YbaK/EbsC (Cys-tRNA(Pro) deacylase)